MTKPGTNSYLVDFDQSISECAFIASQSKTGTGTVPSEASGFAEAALNTGGADQLNVFTFDKGGSATSRSFHVAVFC